MSAHAFGEGAISRCKTCKSIRAKRGRGYVYSAPDGAVWTDTPEPCDSGVLRLDSLVLEQGGRAVDHAVEGELVEGEIVVAADWRRRHIALLDLETTGLDGRINYITEFGIARGVILPNGRVEIQDRYRSLCQVPESHAANAKETEAITGISFESLRDAPSFARVAEEINGFLARSPGDTILAAYNAHFDMPFLSLAFVRAGVEMHPLLLQEAVLDPMVWSRKIDKYVRGGHKLTTVAVRKKLATEEQIAGAHRADFDAELSLRVLGHFSSMVPSNFEELWLWQRAAQGEWEAHYFDYRIKKLREERTAP